MPSPRNPSVVFLTLWLKDRAQSHVRPCNCFPSHLSHLSLVIVARLSTFLELPIRVWQTWWQCLCPLHISLVNIICFIYMIYNIFCTLRAGGGGGIKDHNFKYFFLYYIFWIINFENKNGIWTSTGMLFDKNFASNDSDLGENFNESNYFFLVL